MVINIWKTLDEIITHAKTYSVAHTHTKTDKITGKGGTNSVATVPGVCDKW